MNRFIVLARLNQPIGIWLLLLPCLWGVTLAADGLPDTRLFFLLIAGAIVMRSAGCIFNDIVDRKFDRLVTRTAQRPIAAKTISVFQASVFLSIMLSLGFIILLNFNNFTIWVGVTSLILVFTYPFMKRITFWPQAFLGLTFNWGVLIGWASIKSDLSLSPIILYFAGFFWTLGYDTIYAHQDKYDDISIGVKSTALKFGPKTRVWVSLFFTCAITLFLFCGYLEAMSWIFFLGIFLATLHFIWQVIKLDIDCPEICHKLFLSNRDCGLIIFFSIMLAQLLPEIT